MPDSIDPQTAQAAYDEALKRIEEAAKTEATELALHDLPLTELPPEIGSCKTLKILKLSHDRKNQSAAFEPCPLKLGN